MMIMIVIIVAVLLWFYGRNQNAATKQMHFESTTSPRGRSSLIPSRSLTRQAGRREDVPRILGKSWKEVDQRPLFWHLGVSGVSRGHEGTENVEMCKATVDAKLLWLNSAQRSRHLSFGPLAFRTHSAHGVEKERVSAAWFLWIWSGAAASNGGPNLNK